MGSFRMLLAGLSGARRGGLWTRRKHGDGPDFGPRPISCYPSRRTKAGCPSGQWKRTVNPSRELRRFESFTCHPVHRRASDQRKRGSGPFCRPASPSDVPWAEGSRMAVGQRRGSWESAVAAHPAAVGAELRVLIVRSVAWPTTPGHRQRVAEIAADAGGKPRLSPNTHADQAPSLVDGRAGRSTAHGVSGRAAGVTPRPRPVEVVWGSRRPRASTLRRGCASARVRPPGR